jgi:CRISPR-associated protein Csc1
MMPEVLDLGAAGIRVFAGQLFHHDYLWFSSFEIAKTTRTAPIVHNYALSYAISGYTYGLYRGSRPSYDADLAAMGVYTTPATPGASHRLGWTRFTQNAIDSRTHRTEGPRGINSPALGWRVVLNPCWEEDTVDLGFRFYAFVKSSIALPGVIRLGKKGCPVRLRWTPIAATKARRLAETLQPTHAVNPLDVQGRIVSYQPVSIPPHLLFRQAQIADDWFLLDGNDRIHVPRRFTPAGSSLIGSSGSMPVRSRRQKAQ